VNIQSIMQAKYPDADLSRYFAFLTQATGSDHKHHIAPRSLFPELAKEKANLISLTVEQHVEAHSLLAVQIPAANWPGSMDRKRRYLPDASVGACAVHESQLGRS
jgi:hypothetical protein